MDKFKRLTERAKKGSKSKFKAALSKVKSIEPDSGDRFRVDGKELK